QREYRAGGGGGCRTRTECLITRPAGRRARERRREPGAFERPARRAVRRDRRRRRRAHGGGRGGGAGLARRTRHATSGTARARGPLPFAHAPLTIGVMIPIEHQPPGYWATTLYTSPRTRPKSEAPLKDLPPRAAQRFKRAPEGIRAL